MLKMYKFREGFPAPKTLDAERAYLELERIRQKHGALLSENIVKESKSKKAILHNVFEWNDSLAAHQYRLRQAGNLVRSVLEIKGEEERHLFANVIVTEHERREYVPIQLLLERDDLLNDALRKAVSALNSARDWLNELEKLSPKKGLKAKAGRAKKHLEKAQKSLGIN